MEGARPVKHGAEWYKREPVAYLGGVQGLTAKEHAVYSVVLDLIYQHGGAVNNDPAWFAGWISDMGPASVRKAILGLIGRKKLVLSGDQLTNERATIQAKTKENLRETRAESGSIGGINSGKSRAAAKENNDLGQANGSPREEKTREDNSEDKSSSLLSDNDYQSFLSKHPRSRDSDGGQDAWLDAIDAGADPKEIIAAAGRYAKASKRFDEDKVMFSDNWLSKGAWEKYPAPKIAPKATEAEMLAYWAGLINGPNFIAPSSINTTTAGKLIAAGLVTLEKLKSRGIAA
jgi:hypothetical protein